MRGATPRGTVLVTGSAGLLGSLLVKRLAPRYHVVGFDREGHSRHPPPEAECVCIDLTDRDKLQTALQRVAYAYGKHISSVVHLAAYYDFTGEPSALYDEVTVGGTRNLVELLQEAEFEVDQFVFSSTMLVHAPSTGPGDRIDEASPLEPAWPYPQSKVETERLLHEIRGDMKLATLRIAGVYDERCHSVPLAHQMQRIWEDTPLSHLFPGDLTHGQSFVHRQDTIDALRACVDRRTELPDEFGALIGEPETVSYGELQDQFGEHLFGRPWETRQISKAMAKAGAWLQDVVPGQDSFIKPFMIDLADEHYELDISRAQNLLDWRPRHALRDTIPTMCDFLRADPRRFYRENRLEGEPPLRVVALGQAANPGGP